MSSNPSELQDQARSILDAIAFISFDQCQSLSRAFEKIPARPGIMPFDTKQMDYFKSNRTTL